MLHSDPQSKRRKDDFKVKLNIMVEVVNDVMEVKVRHNMVIVKGTYVDVDRSREDSMVEGDDCFYELFHLQTKLSTVANKANLTDLTE